MIKVLVAVAFYPDDEGNKKLYYVHTRNLFYAKKGIEVTVLNFSTNHNYKIDGINVISLNSFKENHSNYDILINHASNIRNHYIFLKNYAGEFSKKIFFFHGHEIMHLSKFYPKPYRFVKDSSFFMRFLRYGYDSFKLRLWHHYFLKNNDDNTKLVFVSNWMRNVFFNETKIPRSKLIKNTKVIANSVGVQFEENEYDYNIDKKYDFITIRNNIDGSKYSIDVVMREAKNNPEYSFCLVGKGRFFEFNKLPSNVTWINKEMSHSEILELLNHSKCCLMPTRTDAQGVMVCEMATYNMPVITSNIEICREVFQNFENVVLANNNDMKLAYNLDRLIKKEPFSRNMEFTQNVTVNKEVELIKSMI